MFQSRTGNRHLHKLDEFSSATIVEWKSIGNDDVFTVGFVLNIVFSIHILSRLHTIIYLKPLLKILVEQEFRINENLSMFCLFDIFTVLYITSCDIGNYLDLTPSISIKKMLLFDKCFRFCLASEPSY